MKKCGNGLLTWGAPCRLVRQESDLRPLPGKPAGALYATGRVMVKVAPFPGSL